MLKLGIYRVDQYQEAGAGAWSWLRRNRFAYHLLRTSIPPLPREIAIFDNIMQYMRLSSGVYRTTAPGRFRDLDQFVRPILESRFNLANPLLVADWAASDCVTSAEWFESLSLSYPRLQLTASDLSLSLVEVQLPGGASYILEADGNPLQYVQRPFVIPLGRPESSILLVNRWLQSRAESKLARLKQEGCFNGFAEWSNDSREYWEKPPLLFRKIPLTHPRAEALRRASHAFRIERHSVFQATAELYQVIRTMNILSQSYFSAEQLTEGARCVWRSLEPAGIWIVGRTLEGSTEHQVSVLEKTPSGFRLLERHTAPSEIEDLAVALRM
jgi:hypothetical protein